ncbi:MAG TPA: hypothetical protein VHD35_01095 [Chitinophagaceae bacterium]|nr:hypothetical protein [Chitinophagaceae bacterium]
MSKVLVLTNFAFTGAGVCTAIAMVAPMPLAKKSCLLTSFMPCQACYRCVIGASIDAEMTHQSRRRPLPARLHTSLSPWPVFWEKPSYGFGTTYQQHKRSGNVSRNKRSHWQQVNVIK